ncbi:TVP38/TMEM64 family protein [Salinisphaera hydrothermalis]|uniref:TVP38/TMEM64 family membrane protein n=1 Tax=Salinisphaera hydrothermalis (strain C41B8) TaxID=1304275 RepID=A0A084IH24_SALHC|nr:VTT domain-containing protein [Salinisphaera hydrothermalis]KEZ76008.1 hypothetical protein C41B8_16969 [Salinisphaera hydrothermalis C41B8]
MEMTSGTLLVCIALALIGLTLLILASCGLLYAAKNGRRGSLLAGGLVLTVVLLGIDIIILWCLIEYSLAGVNFSIDGLPALMAQAGLWAPLASIALMAAHSFVPFPAEVIAVANGVVFGPWLGVLITWSGAMIGALLSYEIARALGPAARTRLVPRRYRARLDAFTIHIGVAPLLVARLLPIVSFNLINYAAGLAGVPRLTFAWTTGLGILPLTVISVLLGSHALRLPVYVWIVVGFGALLFLLATRAIRRVLVGAHQRNH